MGGPRYSMQSGTPFATATSTTSRTGDDANSTLPPAAWATEAQLPPLAGNLSREIVVGVERETHIFVEGPADVESYDGGIAI